VRKNAHALEEGQRVIVDHLLEAGTSVSRIKLTAMFCPCDIKSLEEAGHLCEVMSGELFLTPLTVRELEAYRPWRAEDEELLRSVWGRETIQVTAGKLDRTGGDVLQHAWQLGLDRKNRFDEDFAEHVPAWRIRRLRLLLAETERRGLLPDDDGADLHHRALQRRFNKGRALRSEVPKHFEKWSRSDVAHLRRMRDEGQTVSRIAIVLGRTVAAVSSKIGELGISAHANWTLEEDTVVADGVKRKLSNKEIAAMLPGRTANAINQRAAKLGLTGPRAFRPWTQKERDAVREAVKIGAKYSDIAAWLGRTTRGVNWQVRVMGLTHPASTLVKTYSKSEDEEIRRGWRAGERPADVAARLGRPVRSVYCRAFHLGVTGEKANYRRRITPSEIARLRRLASKGMSGEQIAQKLCRSKMAVYRLATKNGIRIESRKGALNQQGAAS